MSSELEIIPLCEVGVWISTLAADNIKRVIEKVKKNGRKSVDEVEETGLYLGTLFSGIFWAPLKTVP
jgi:hypothetical protein